MQINFIAVIVAALVTFVIGFLWYNPKVLGTKWMQSAGLSEEELQKGNMVKIFGLSLLFSIFIAFSLNFMVIHQFGAMGMIGGDDTLDTIKPSYFAFMEDYGMAFRTFKHGMLHGSLVAIFFAFPILAINALFEQKCWTYILINAGYWLVCLTIMGGIICAWK